MKTITILLLATVLTGCAGPNGQQFMQKFGEGMQYQAAMQQQQAQQNQRAYQPIKSEQMDFQCFQNCQQAGYQYGLCKSKCSY